MTLSLRPILRQLLRSPGFALTVTLFLGLTTAALLALGTAAWGLLAKPMPFAQGERLVEARGYSEKMGFGLGYSVPLALQLEDSPEFEAVGLLRRVPGFEDAEGRELSAVGVSDGLVRLLGVRPLLGRLPTADEPADSVLLSESFWTRALGRDPGVLLRPLELSGRSLRVIGVLPEDQAFPSRDTALWLPLQLSAEERAASAAASWSILRVYGRLAEGVTPAAAQAALNARYDALPELDEMRAFMGLTVRVTPLRELWAGERTSLLRDLSLAAALVLLTLIANLASLWIGRALARQKELSMRSALGASDWRTAAPLLGEVALLTALGLGLGLALTPLALDALTTLRVLDASTPLPVRADVATVAGALGLGLLLFALLSVGPLWLVRRGLRVGVLGGGGRSLSPGRSGARARRVLVTLQLGVAIALLAGVGLLLRSFLLLMEAEQGFSARDFVMAEVVPRQTLDAAGQGSLAQRVQTWFDAVASLPGVRAASFSSSPPYSRSEAVSAVRVDAGEVEVSARDRFVGADYFRILGQPVLAGRGFAPSDPGTDAVIVDEAFAERHLQGAAVGARIDLYDGSAYRAAEVIGVVRTVKHDGPDEQVELGTVYRVLARPGDSARLGRFALLETDTAAPALAERLEELASAQGLRLVRALQMSEWIELSLAPRLPLLWLLGGFALACVLLCCTGLFALLQFAVGSRRAEFGLKLALGSTPRRLVREVLGGSLRGLWPGLLLGLGGAVLVGRLLASRLYGVSSFDPASLAAVLAALLIAVLLAAWLPARRAARVAPAEVLRQE